MAATSETEIIGELVKADEKMMLRLRETADTYRGIATHDRNRELLSEARTDLQAAITALLQVKW